MRMRFLLLLIITLGSANFSLAQTPDAFVESLKGIAWVRNAADSKPMPLRDKSGLFSGQRVSCSSGCKELKISYCNHAIKVDVPRGPNWKLIVGLNCDRQKQRVRAGILKGDGTSIISPKESQHLVPESFSLRWKPFPAGTKLELSLRISLGEKIWGPETVDGSRGSYHSRSLKARLETAQASEQLILVLTLDDQKNPKQAAKFYLLSVAEQKDMERRLVPFASETNRILKNVGRGSVFGEFDLHAESAREFENALAIAEKQKAEARTLVELATLAIVANDMAYNDDRVKELCRSTTMRVSSLPEACRINK